MASIFSCCPVNCECLWKKTQVEAKSYTSSKPKRLLIYYDETLTITWHEITKICIYHKTYSHQVCLIVNLRLNLNLSSFDYMIVWQIKTLYLRMRKVYYHRLHYRTLKKLYFQEYDENYTQNTKPAAIKF